jgi:hypothetical protein
MEMGEWGGVGRSVGYMLFLMYISGEDLQRGMSGREAREERGREGEGRRGRDIVEQGKIQNGLLLGRGCSLGIQFFRD